MDDLVSSFLEVTGEKSTDTAVQYLEMTNLKLDEAIQLFYTAGDDSGGSWTSAPVTRRRQTRTPVIEVDAHGVPLPLPVITQTLHTPSSGPTMQETSEPDDVWEGTSDRLASMYRPPYDLMFRGRFNNVKIEAANQNKWLLVNIQSLTEFASHMLNRDTWANKDMVEVIKAKLIFWQVDMDSTEGKKVCNYYNLATMPTILLLDPITGQKMNQWSGMVESKDLIQGLSKFLFNGPNQYCVRHPKSIVSEQVAEFKEQLLTETEKEDESVKELEEEVESIKLAEKPSYPPLPEEPKGEKGLLCRVGVRLPDGRRVQRNFLREDPVQFLWSFCSPMVKDGSFHFTQPMPGVSKKQLDLENFQTFDEAGLANSMLTLVLD